MDDPLKGSNIWLSNVSFAFHLCPCHRPAQVIIVNAFNFLGR